MPTGKNAYQIREAVLLSTKSRQKLIVFEPEPFWTPSFQRELGDEFVEVVAASSFSHLTTKIHPEDHVLLWAVLSSEAGEQIRELTTILQQYQNLALVLISPPLTQSLKWVLYELNVQTVLDSKVSLSAALQICRRYWKSGTI